MPRRQWFDVPATTSPLAASLLNDLEDRKLEADQWAINVKAPPYNVTGLGLVDEYTPIQAAITAVGNNGGGIVLLPRGTYLIGTALSIPNDVQVWGEGYSTRIDAVGNHYLFNFNPGHRARVTNLHINKATSAQSSGGGFDYTLAGNNITVDHITVSHRLHTIFNCAPGASAPGNGIYFIDRIRFNGSASINTGFKIGTGNDLVTDVEVSHCKGTGATTADVGIWADILLGSDTIQFEDCLFYRGTKGVRVGNSGSGSTVSGSRLRNVTIDNIAERGLELVKCREFDVDNCDIQGCDVSLGGYQGVVLGGATTGVKIQGGNIRMNYSNGITIFAGAAHTDIIGVNVLGNNQNNGGFSDGIAVAANTTDFKIIGCRVGNVIVTGGHQKYGINITAGTSDRYVVQGNDCQNNESGTLLDGGTGSVKSVDSNLPLGIGSVASGATILLPSGDVVLITGTANITSITAQAGRSVTLVFTGTASSTGLTNGSNLLIGANFVYTPNDAITLACDGTNWYRPAVGAAN